jgi:hypothetical protein
VIGVTLIILVQTTSNAVTRYQKNLLAEQVTHAQLVEQKNYLKFQESTLALIHSLGIDSDDRIMNLYLTEFKKEEYSDPKNAFDLCVNLMTIAESDKDLGLAFEFEKRYAAYELAQGVFRKKPV